jgi:hypothetical protein
VRLNHGVRCLAKIMTEHKKSILHTIAALSFPLVVPLWLLLRGEPASVASVVAWPFLYIIASLQVVWLRLRSRRCETESQRKLSCKVYNTQAIACFFLGLYEAAASLALSGVANQRLPGVLVFTVYLYVPYALLTLWSMKSLDTLLNSSDNDLTDRQAFSEAVPITSSKTPSP